MAHMPFLLVGTLCLALAISIVVRSKRRMQSAKPHTPLDYFLLWPLVFDQSARRERVSAGRDFFTIRELIGAAAFLLILTIGFIFF